MANLINLNFFKFINFVQFELLKFGMFLSQVLLLNY